MTMLSERGESNKTDAKEVLYEASYEAPLTRKTRLNMDFEYRVFCTAKLLYLLVQRSNQN